MCLVFCLIRYENLVGVDFRFSLYILFWRDQIALVQPLRSSQRALNQAPVRYSQVSF